MIISSIYTFYIIIFSIKSTIRRDRKKFEADVECWIYVEILLNISNKNEIYRNYPIKLKFIENFQ